MEEKYFELDCHSVETVTLSKYVSEQKQIQNGWSIQDGGIAIGRVNSIRVSKPLIFFNILGEMPLQLASKVVMSHRFL